MTQEPVLMLAQLSFHTNDAGKKEDTHVTVTVRTNNGSMAARIDDNFGYFNENSDNGIYDLEITNQAPKSELKGGNTMLRIDPNGPNTWRFNFFVDFIFTDGSHLSSNATNIKLDEKSQQQTFGIS